MAFGEVIDLLSSEDEAAQPLCVPTIVKPIAKTSAAKDDFLHLSDEFDTTVYFNESWAESASKKRKLSPPLDDEDNTHAFPKLPKPRKPIVTTQGASKSASQDEYGWKKIEESDPIIFTSSAHGETTASRAGRRAIDALPAQGDDSDDSLPDDILSASLCATNAASALSERTAALLATLRRSPARRKPPNIRKPSGSRTEKGKARVRSPTGDTNSVEPLDGNKVQAQGTKASRKPKLTDEEKAVKAREKDEEKVARREQKEKEKEDDKEKKRLEKEEKAKEKRIAADLAEVNKSKLDKKDSTPEMIVNLPASIDGQSVNTQIREFLKNLGVDATWYQSPIPNVVKWRRKIKAKWNPELDHWEPLEHMQIENEKHVLCIMSAKEFVALATVHNEDQDVETHVAKLKSAYNDCIPIYLIEGLHLWMRKNRTAENRAYQAKVLSQAQVDETPAGNQSKRKKAPVEIVDEDMIEDVLLRLQVMNECLVHHTMTSVETAEWVANFTQHISTIPYRMQRMNLESSFCMESGQVKTGEDKDDTFVKMLQEVVRVTPPIAYGIASEYPSVVALVRAFGKHGPLVLEDLQKSANRNGALTDRKIGPAISRRLYKVFMDTDPGSTDV
ncbi:MAG: hypothetical protein ASARMPRED_005558 [Alectoria sarmentosa]|nr:MAG: hypothetical protein ASARMPRED_005558 [Alectoria sarmentosa]